MSIFSILLVRLVLSVVSTTIAIPTIAIVSPVIVISSASVLCVVISSYYTHTTPVRRPCALRRPLTSDGPRHWPASQYLQKRCIEVCIECLIHRGLNHYLYY